MATKRVDSLSSEDRKARERLFADLHVLAEKQKQDRIRYASGFDGLLSEIPSGTSLLLARIVRTLQHHLQRKYSDARAKQLLGSVAAGLGPPRDEEGYDIPADDLLALQILGNQVAQIVNDKQGMADAFLGPLGVQEAKRRDASKRPRRPHIDEFIRKRLTLDPTAKGTDLWDQVPSSISDDIGRDRFLKRVSKVRKEIRQVASK